MGALLFILPNANATNKDSIVINKVVDTITSEISYMTSNVLLCKKPNATDYFYVDVYVNSNYHFDLLFIKKNGIGSCNGDDILTFYFTDGTNMELKSYNSFRCDDLATFSLTKGEKLLLSYKEIKGIRYTNGYSFDSYTHPVPATSKRHFIQVMKSHEEGIK
jgi:hypothetical protein